MIAFSSNDDDSMHFEEESLGSAHHHDAADDAPTRAEEWSDFGINAEAASQAASEKTKSKTQKQKNNASRLDAHPQKTRRHKPQRAASRQRQWRADQTEHTYKDRLVATHRADKHKAAAIHRMESNVLSLHKQVGCVAVDNDTFKGCCLKWLEFIWAVLYFLLITQAVGMLQRWVRRRRSYRFAAEGRRMLAAAQDIVPSLCDRQYHEVCSAVLQGKLLRWFPNGHPSLAQAVRFQECYNRALRCWKQVFCAAFGYNTGSNGLDVVAYELSSIPADNTLPPSRDIEVDVSRTAFKKRAKSFREFRASAQVCVTRCDDCECIMQSRRAYFNGCCCRLVCEQAALDAAYACRTQVYAGLCSVVQERVKACNALKKSPALKRAVKKDRKKHRASSDQQRALHLIEAVDAAVNGLVLQLPGHPHVLDSSLASRAQVATGRTLNSFHEFRSLCEAIVDNVRDALQAADAVRFLCRK